MPTHHAGDAARRRHSSHSHIPAYSGCNVHANPNGKWLLEHLRMPLSIRDRTRYGGQTDSQVPQEPGMYQRWIEVALIFSLGELAEVYWEVAPGKEGISNRKAL